MPQAMKIPAAKAAVDKGTGKIEKNSTVRPDESQKSETSDRRSKDEGRKTSFSITDGHISLKECGIGGKAPEIKRSSWAPR